MRASRPAAAYAASAILAALAAGAVAPSGAAAAAPASRAAVPRHPTVFVANRGSRTVTAISTATNRAIKEITVGRLPAGHRGHPGL